MRIESNPARRKLRLEVWYIILLGYHHIAQLITTYQLAVDEQQISIMESATSMEVPSPAAGTCLLHHKFQEYSPVMVPSATAIPAKNVSQPTLPLPATTS